MNPLQLASLFALPRLFAIGPPKFTRGRRGGGTVHLATTRRVHGRIGCTPARLAIWSHRGDRALAEIDNPPKASARQCRRARARRLAGEAAAMVEIGRRYARKPKARHDVQN